MNKLITKNVLCYSQHEFNNIMQQNNWITCPPYNVACISICYPQISNAYEEHWFKNDWNNNIGYHDPRFRIFNLDIDDCGPFWFKSHENTCYDKSLELYKQGKIEESNAYFNHLYISGDNDQYCDMLHVLNYQDAFNLVEWIDYIIKKCDVIYVHCTAGASRSQGVVRYILDTYSNEYNINTNPNNPCLTPNSHVVLMLKRAYRELFNV